MKKIVLTGIAAALIVGAFTFSASAMGNARGLGQNNDGLHLNNGTLWGYNYVDADGDGVCDNYGTGWGRNYVDADGDGECDNYGTGCGSRHYRNR